MPWTAGSRVQVPALAGSQGPGQAQGDGAVLDAQLDRDRLQVDLDLLVQRLCRGSGVLADLTQPGGVGGVHGPAILLGDASQGPTQAASWKKRSRGTPDGQGAEVLAEKAGRGVFEVVGLIDDRPVEAGQDSVAAGLALLCQVGQEQVLVDHDHVGQSRLTPGLVVEAGREVGTAGAQGLIVVGTHPFPGVLTDRKAQVGPAAPLVRRRPGSQVAQGFRVEVGLVPGAVGEHRVGPGGVPDGLGAMGQLGHLVRQPAPAQVVAATREHGGAHVQAAALQQGQVGGCELALQGDGVRGHSDATLVGARPQGGGHQVGQGLAGAGTRFQCGHDGPFLVAGVQGGGHRQGHFELTRPWLPARQHARQGIFEERPHLRLFDGNPLPSQGLHHPQGSPDLAVRDDHADAVLTVGAGQVQVGLAGIQHARGVVVDHDLAGAGRTEQGGHGTAVASAVDLDLADPAIRVEAAHGEDLDAACVGDGLTEARRGLFGEADIAGGSGHGPPGTPTAGESVDWAQRHLGSRRRSTGCGRRSGTSAPGSREPCGWC